MFCAVWGILLPNTSFLESFFARRWSCGLQLNEEVFSMAEEITQQHFLVHLFYSENKEGNVLFNNALNTFYLRLYGIRHMVKDHSESEKEEGRRKCFI